MRESPEAKVMIKWGKEERRDKTCKYEGWMRRTVNPVADRGISSNMRYIWIRWEGQGDQEERVVVEVESR